MLTRVKWRTVKLADVADARLGKMLDAQKNRGRLHPYLANPNVRWFDVDLSNLKEMPFEEDEEEKFSIRDGDVLICEGGEAGRAAIWNGPDIGIKFQKAIHRVRPSGELLNRFLVHRLFYDYHSSGLNDYYTGTTISHLTGQDLARYAFPLPPAEEQRRIVAILDEVDDLLRKRREVLQQTEDLTRAIFLEVFGNPIRNTKGWRQTRLSDASQLIQIGPFGSLLHKADYIVGGVSLINPMHIQNGILRPDPAYSISREKCLTLSIYQLRNGDVVMGRRGEMGRCAIVQKEHDGLICGTGSLFIRPNEDIATAVYLYFVLSSAGVKRRLEDASLGATLPNLNTSIVANLIIPVPPLNLQNAFATRVAEIDKLKTHHHAHLAKLDALFASLQHRAFRGEL